MPYCVKCGVELEQEEKCPLCGTKIYNPDNINPAENKHSKMFERASVRYLKNKYINITGFCIIICMIISFIIDISVSGNISWLKYVLSSSVFLWFCMVFPVKYSDKLHPIFIICLCLISAALYILYIDYLTIFDGWSLYIFFSVLLISFGLSFPMLVENMRAKNIISIIAAAAAVYIAVLDFKIGYAGWSIYVIGAMALIWAFSLLPFYIKRKYSVIGAIFFDSLLILAYLFFVLSANGHTDKFISFALPLTAALSLPVMFIYLIDKRFKYSAYGILSLCFLFAGLIAIPIDYILNFNIFNDNVLFHEASIIITACCLFISPLLFIIEKNSRLQEFLNKKFNL